MVPVDIGREVIIAARRSALAQICKLDEHQIANYRSMMLREVQKKKWSDQQIVFINMLHLTTVQIFAGDITIKLQGRRRQGHRRDAGWPTSARNRARTPRRPS